MIVPVKDRRALLRSLLDGLAAQTLAAHEVIVVDDHSSDGAPLEAEADARIGRPVRVVANAGVGAYAGRRTGVLHARAPYLAFTDSDCVPDAEWLARGVAALDAGADLVNGRTVPERPAGPLERTMASGEEGLYPTCNVFYRRSAYDAAGGFDDTAADRFGFRPGTPEQAMGFGEDTLLAWRVRRAGHAVYEPRAVVRHHVFPADLGDLWRRTKMMVAFPALFREVPELRAGPLVRHGIVLNTPTRLPVYLFVAALAAHNRRAVRAVAAWWVVRRVYDARRLPGPVSRRIASVPVQVGMDALTTAALLVGGAKTRTIVL